MIIIFEGADGTGKSTAVSLVADEIRRRYEVEPRLLHRGPPTRDPLLEYTVDLEDDTIHDWTICDRWHWGELIYGPLYRGRSLLSGAGHMAIDQFLARRGAFLIHMDEQWAEVTRRVNERGDDYVEKKHLPFILEEYRRIRELDSPLRRQTMFDFNAVKAAEVVSAAVHIARAERRV